MANLPETPQWEEGIYQIEVSDPVLGGPDGISNRQGKQLASRTLYLKQQVENGGSDLAKHIAAADPHTQYAPKASPTFTGTPTAPTPANSDNSKKLATTEFVAKALAALAGSAPETLDTLKELADALGNDPNFATTVLNKLAEKLAKDQNGADIPDPALFVKNLGLGTLQSSFTDKSGKIALNGGWGLGIKADQTTGTMAALDVSRFDYFAPADNIGPYPGQWAGGISFANSGSTGWQICGVSLGSIPDFSVRIKTSQTAFSNWYKLYHTGFKPTPADINAIQRDACDVAGFISNNQQDPYMRHSASQNLIQLATRQFVSQSISSLSLGTAATKNVGTGAGQIPDMSSFTSGTGWASLPGGTIIQWGIAASGQIGDPQTINFPVPFTNYSTVQLVASYDNAGASVAPYSFAAQPISNTQFKLLNSITSSAVIYARWIAIGR
ncbi:TPA: phage tail protein [Escherichia coli]